MKHILTLTDFSPVAEAAVETAFVFAQQHGADLTIYHNSEDGDLVMYELVGDSEIEHFALEKAISTPPVSKWKALAKKHNINARYLTGCADFIKKIYKVTDVLEIDLIVMGSTGAHGRKGYVWGSNTEKVIKHVDIPVLVLKKPVRNYRLKNIVFASSFDSQEKDVLKFALDLLQPDTDATIHLLSVDTSSFFSQPMALMQAAMKEFKEVAAPYTAKSHFYNDYSIEAGIRHFMEELKPDLLIMSNKNEKPVKRMFFGSNTIDAINHSDYPVLSVDYNEQT